MSLSSKEQKSKKKLILKTIEHLNKNTTENSFYGAENTDFFHFFRFHLKKTTTQYIGDEVKVHRRVYDA